MIEGVLRHCTDMVSPNGTICMWGGIGKEKNRPFLEFASQVEIEYPEWKISNWITWNKKRAYGLKNNYLFTREECLILTKNTPTFHIPYLKTVRPYEGYNKKYPAKSKYYRRSNVWNDITEVMRDKIHPCQKPDKLYEVLIETHSNEGDTVYDPCCGSGTAARAAYNTGRKFVVVEQRKEYLESAKLFPVIFNMDDE